MNHKTIWNKSLDNISRHAGLWRGTAVTLVRDWPSFGVYFAVYEGMQEVLQPGSRASKEIHPLALLTAGQQSCTYTLL